MKFSILLPHYKTGRMTAYAVAQLIKFKGKHDIEIIIINNSFGDDSINHIIGTELWTQCRVVNYPKELMQSHGIAFDYVLSNNYVSNEHFITIESDSFPTQDNWLDSYEEAVNQGFDAIGSVLQLSGGVYMHPAGAMYKKSVWEQCYKYCRVMQFEYLYFPNMVMKEEFPCHAMIKRERLAQVVVELQSKLHHSYQALTVSQMIDKAINYLPVINPFHNGMGNTQEAYSTYRLRTIYDYNKDTMLDGKEDLILRMGYEPGQFFSYWMMNRGYAIGEIPTEMKWLPNRENQQQEYSKMDNGFVHLWAITAYADCEVPELQDIVVFKHNQLDELYNSLPEKYRL